MFDIVMSLYNKAAFVGATIDAVIAQTHRDWRLFVVDDGSTDTSAEVVRAYGDPRIALIEQSNQGVGPARNAGIAAGSQAWIALLDADDLWNADHLHELAAVIERFPEAVLAGCGFTRFTGSFTPQAQSGGRQKRHLVRYFADCARGRELFFTSSAAVRRSAIGTVGAFEPLPGNEDVELWARLALAGPIAVSERKTVYYRLATGGITERGMGGRAQPPRPMRREEMSSTIPTLTRLLPTVSDKRLRKDVRAYMDSRVGLALVEAVLSGDFDYARHVRTLYESKPTGKARIAHMLARLPGPMARAAVAGGRALQRALRRLRG